MKNLIFIIIHILYGVLGFISVAQNQKATIIYKAEVQQTYVDSFIVALNNKKDVSMLIKQQVTDSYRNAKPQYFVLNVSNNESFYFEDEALDLAEGYNLGSLAPFNDLYTNRDTGLIVDYTRPFGKVKRNHLDWDLSSGETKEIGGYTCFKATATERLYSRQGFYYNREVIAWFTPELPLHFGPSHYTGLPGLVIKVIRDKFTITASEIILNPEADIKIKTLTKDDKMISEEQMHRNIGAIMEEQRNGG